MIYIHYIGGYVFLHEFLDKRRVYKSKRVHFLKSHYKLENSPLYHLILSLAQLQAMLENKSYHHPFISNSS